MRVVILYDADSSGDILCLNLVATHDRCDIPYTYRGRRSTTCPVITALTTRISRNSSNVRRRFKISFWDYLREADCILMHYPPTGLKQLSGILSSRNSHGTDRLIAACVCASQKSEYGYQALREVLNRAMTPTSSRRGWNSPYPGGIIPAPVHKKHPPIVSFSQFSNGYSVFYNSNNGKK